MNNFFSNIVKKLEIPKFDSVTVNIEDPVFKAIWKYKNHASILEIRKNSKNKIFDFEEVKIGEIKNEILKLDKTKAPQKTNIPIIFVEVLLTSINGAIKSASFSSSLKLADITPLHKKERKDMIKNLRPVSIPPPLSKIFEKCMFTQMSTFFDNIFSNQQCGLREGYST